MFSLTMLYCALSFGFGIFFRKGSLTESILGIFVFLCISYTVLAIYLSGISFMMGS